MDQKQIQKQFVAVRSYPNDSFSEEAIAEYWRVLALPALAAVALLVRLHLVVPVLQQWQELVLEAALFVVLSVLSFRRFGRVMPQALIVNAMAGFLVGLAVAILRIAQHFSFYLVFNLLAEPAVVVGLGLLTGWVVAFLQTRLLVRQLLSQ